MCVKYLKWQNITNHFYAETKNCCSGIMLSACGISETPSFSYTTNQSSQMKVWWRSSPQTPGCGCQNSSSGHYSRAWESWFQRRWAGKSVGVGVLLGRGRTVAWGHSLPIITTFKNDAQVVAKHDLPQGSIRKSALCTSLLLFKIYQ